jgi:hypothetical protein
MNESQVFIILPFRLGIFSKIHYLKVPQVPPVGLRLIIQPKINLKFEMIHRNRTKNEIIVENNFRWTKDDDGLICECMRLLSITRGEISQSVGSLNQRPTLPFPFYLFASCQYLVASAV